MYLYSAASATTASQPFTPSIPRWPLKFIPISKKFWCCNFPQNVWLILLFLCVVYFVGHLKWRNSKLIQRDYNKQEQLSHLK